MSLDAALPVCRRRVCRITTFANEAGPTIGWLEGLGLRFDFLPTQFLTKSQPRLLPVGGGLALVEGLAARAETLDVTFFYETTRTGLQTEAGGQVTGLVGRIRGERPSMPIPSSPPMSSPSAASRWTAPAASSIPTASRSWASTPPARSSAPTYRTYTGATSVLKGLVFGQLAGADAAINGALRTILQASIERHRLDARVGPIHTLEPELDEVGLAIADGRCGTGPPS